MAIQDILVPDIGNFDSVDVIEVLVKAGDTVAKEDSLITVESDKASMDIPAPFAGVVKEVKMKVGDKASEGSLILTMDVSAAAAPSKTAESKPAVPPAATPVAAVAIPEPSRPAPEPPKTIAPVQKPAPVGESVVVATGKLSHASPSVRKFARELGVNLALVKGSAAKNRILQADVQAYVKEELAKPRTENMGAGVSGFAALPMPVIDFSQFGEIVNKPLSRIKKLSGANLHRNWVTAPHVTQFDEADITELEKFRKEQNEVAKDFKLSPLVFVVKAVAKALEIHPKFNASLSADGQSLILKKYFHIAIAVDTPNGLVVPVIRDVNKKGFKEIAIEMAEISQKAREGKLKSSDMQ
ncbi:MAG: branched-chain alpha-keto acid dehydrogenase subunit E2, partial [Betaproteobacteria bacterium HGW-Betaproteobacteria-20]